MILDISLTGALVEANKLPDLGSEVRLFIGDSAAPKAVAVGRVIRVDPRKPKEFAVEFLGPDHDFVREAIKWS